MSVKQGHAHHSVLLICQGKGVRFCLTCYILVNLALSPEFGDDESVLISKINCFELNGHIFFWSCTLTLRINQKNQN